MPSRSNSTMKLLSFFLAVVAPAHGYSTTNNRPFARPFGIEDFSAALVKKETPPKIKQTYDLGIGKNQPLAQKRSYTVSNVVRDDAAQFLGLGMEHESVRPYPSPLDYASLSPASPAKSPLPKVQLKRNSEDMLAIRNSDNFTPDIIPISDAQLDVNTVWVEMMIHSEQMKLALA